MRSSTSLLWVLQAILISLWAFCGIAYAQSSDYEKAQSFVKEGETKAAIDQVKEEKLLGRVSEIKVGGEPSTRLSVILNQLTFKVGDKIYLRDLALSYKRLNQLGLFWYIQIRYEPAGAEKKESEAPEEVIEEDTDEAPVQGSDKSPVEGEETIEIESQQEGSGKPGVIIGASEEVSGEGDIIVYVDVWQAPSYYAFPFESGAIIGDKDFLITGKTVEAGYFQSGKEFQYWHLRYYDPQFNGSHNGASCLVSHLKDLYGVRDEKNFDLGERYTLNRDSIKFMINTRYKENRDVEFGLEWQDNDTSYRNGYLWNANRFYLSDEEFTGGTELISKFAISGGNAKGYPWIKKGYTWSLGTDQAIEGLGSDHTFGRYRTTGTVYLPFDSLIDTAVLHAEYETITGSPPHYQKPRLGYSMRGHTSLDYFGDSTVYLSGELRKAFWDDRFQGVAFVDLGKGYDSRVLSVRDLDVSSGLGIRINVVKFVNLGIILRADYAWGLNGDRWTFGLGQWFY